MKDAHIVLAAVLLAAGFNCPHAKAVTLQEAVGLGLKDLSPAADGALFASHPLAGAKTGDLSAQLKASEHFAAAAELQARASRETAALQVAEVYFDMLRAHYRLAAAQKQVALHEEALKANQDSREAGAIEERLEVAKAAVRVSLAEMEKIRPAFLKKIGKEPGQLEIPPVVTMLQQPVIEIDVLQNLAFQAAQKKAQAREAEVELAKSLWDPHLNVEAKADDSVPAQNSPASADELPSVGEAVRLAEASFAEAMEERIKADRLASEALETYSLASARIKQQAASASDVLELANEIEADQQAGKRSVLELLEVRNEQFRTETAYAESHIEQRRHAYRLLAATGQLISHLKIDQIAQPAQVIAATQPEPKSEADIAEMPAEAREPAKTAEEEAEPEKKVIAVVEPAAKTVASMSLPAPKKANDDSKPEADEKTRRETGVRRLGSQIVAMVEPPKDLLPVSSREVTRRKREPKKPEKERARPLKKIFNFLKREKYRKNDRPD